jgi:hypothetical protein
MEVMGAFLLGAYRIEREARKLVNPRKIASAAALCGRDVRAPSKDGLVI